MTLDLCVVADRSCSTSRTYLTYLADAGHRVREVAVLDFHRGALPQRPRGLRARLAALRSAPAGPPDPGPDFWRLCEGVQGDVRIPIDYASDFDFGAIAEQTSEFAAADYADPAFHAFLAGRSTQTFLYTNGGRVPAALLDTPGLRILHNHPGVVPDIRGSDGLLWSLLERGVPGASCFYMDVGLDTGALSATREFPAPRFAALRREIESDPELFYRALLFAYDPHQRAETFLDALAKGDDPGALPAREQDPAEGRQYFAMHPRLQNVVYERISRG
jgi:hypothetical protein